MNRTAKFVSTTLRWKKGKNLSYKDKTSNLDATKTSEKLAYYKTLFDETQVSLPLENQVCSIKESPYRILKAIETENVDDFISLYRQDPRRLYFKDATGKSAIHYASAKNNLDILKFIYEVGFDLNVQDKNGNTALHHAVMNNSLQCLSYLIQNGADSSILNDDMYGPIHVAVIQNRVNILQEMVKNKSKVNVMLRGKYGRSALHFAAIHDHDECARILLSLFNCCPRTPCNNGSYAIHEAAKNASAKTLEAILEWGEKILGVKRESMMKLYDAEGNVPLHSAVHSGDIKAVALCLKSGATLSTQQHDLSTPVHLACSQGAIDIVKLMFNSQPHEKTTGMAIRDAQHFTPLHCAASFDHDELVRYLVKEGASMTAIDKEGRTPLLLAGARASWKSVIALIELKADVSWRDNFNRNIFHHIVLSGGNLDKFTELISNQIQEPVYNLLNDRDLLGCTPLHYASRDGQFKTIQSLLQMGAVINLKNNDNQSPLHFAARYGRLNTAKHLLESRKGHLIINDMDGEGMTPLHIASQNGHTKIVQYLLIKGALLHRDHKGRTPLHWAAINGHVETIQQILLVHSHLLNQVDKDGNSALTLATINNRPAVAMTLLSLDCSIIPNNDDMTPLDYMIANKNSEVAMVMVMHPKRGEEIMNSKVFKYSSLLEGLIATMPEVVKNLLDNCIQKSDINEDSKNYFIKYNFSHLQSKKPFDHSTDQPLPILNLMIAYGREDLLSHNLCVKYLETKWNSYGMFCHMMNMSFYLIFLALITANGLKVVDITHAVKLEEKNIDDISSLKLDTLVVQSEVQRVHFISIWILIFVLLNILKEFYQIYHQKYRYFQDYINISEWTLYLAAGIMSSSFLFLNIHSSYLYISTTFSVFIAWFNLLFFLQQFNRGGIYVVMFLEILSTLIRVIFLFSVLIIAFGLSFYILFAKFDSMSFGKGFSKPALSMIRVGTMMLGEVDFITTFLGPILGKQTDQVFLSRQARVQLFTSLLFLVIFIILMPILLMNLLIGLAVGDIETVRKNAQIKRLTMQVDLHTDLERKLPRKFINKLNQTKMIHIDYPNRCCTSNFVFRFYSKYFLSKQNMRTICSPVTSPSLSQQKYDLVNFKSDVESQMMQQRKKIRELSKNSELQLELLRLIIQKMEIQTENDFGSDGENDY